MLGKVNYYAKRLLIRVMNICKFLVRTEKGKIVLMDYTPFSGSNSWALYDYIKNEVGYKNVEIVRNSELEGGSVLKYIKAILNLLRAEVLLTTHDLPVCKKSQLLIQMWHGIPLKAMGLLDKTISAKDKKYAINSFNRYNYIVSSSTFYNTLMNACTGNCKGNYILTGFPRNDYLYAPGKLRALYPEVNFEGKKIVLFVPTFRLGYMNRREGIEREKNIFGFDTFDVNSFLIF
ncbi:CDP-glycerol glycerophosphotransferase family protein [Caldanaerobius polysaccharolyticus]|uniref:CDP-glycerol glycerophosphotransferase family protein n=1 Tax=Caldanaerobius polysaccharolyticus TaxID=44256 RepID=UPI00047D1893|nr:CDP-glycerol glycerophosphotransferase family protein [Caldanaerobius polysaccharolyticus]